MRLNKSVSFSSSVIRNTKFEGLKTQIDENNKPVEITEDFEENPILKKLKLKLGSVFITTKEFESEFFIDGKFEKLVVKQGIYFTVCSFGYNSKFQAYRKGTIVLYNEENNAIIPLVWSEKIARCLELIKN